MTAKLKLFATLATFLALGACSGGINAGGESPTSNGGIAWIAMAGMLIAIGIILWIVLGRED